MATKTFSFVEQLERGKAGEKILDEYFSRWYNIEELNVAKQLETKADRIFRPKNRAMDRPVKSQEKFLVEYKTDERTDSTGNLFIETMSAEETSTYGWAWTSQADKLMYFALPDTIYIIDVQELRIKLMDWYRQRRRQVSVKNRNGRRSYTTRGFTIPVDEIVHLIGRKNVRRLS